MALQTRFMSKIKLQRIDSANQGGHVGASMILPQLLCRKVGVQKRSWLDRFNVGLDCLTLWLTWEFLLDLV